MIPNIIIKIICLELKGGGCLKYKLQELTDDMITDFLLNPLSKTAYYRDYVVQKYPINEHVDHMIFFDKEGLFFNNVGYVLYEKEEIVITDGYVDGEYAFNKKVVNSGKYIPREKIEWDLRCNTNRKIKDIENSGRVNIESIADYNNKLEAFKAKYHK